MPLLPRRSVGSRLYWGEQWFVDEQIRLLESGQGKRLGSGSFGVGWAIGPYLVKKTHNPTPDAPKVTRLEFEAEADAANMLQDKIPDFVTQIKGARYGSGDRNDYIIFDLLQGDTLAGYIKELHKEAFDLKMTSTTLHRNLSYLFQALKVSSKAMNDIGWSHCDLKPANVFFNVQKKNGSYDWSTAICWLIDFGGATKFGKELPFAITPVYSITHITEKKLTNAQCSLPINTLKKLIAEIGYSNICNEQIHVSEKYNSASCDLVWLVDMKKLLINAPEKPLTILDLGFKTQQEYVAYRKGLLNKLRSQSLLPDPQPRLQVDQQAAQRQAALNAQKAAYQAALNAQQAAQKAAERQAALNAQQAERQAAQQVPQKAAQQAPKEPYFTKNTQMINGILYREVTNGKDTWWQDPAQEPHWTLPKKQAGGSRYRTRRRRHK